MDQKFVKWRKWLEIIYKEEVWEVVTYQRIFREIQAMINRNLNIQKPNLFYRFIGRTYYDYAVIAIRRQIKPQKDSISFVGLLEDIRKSPCVLSRERFVNLYLVDIQDEANCIFDEKFAGICTDHIDPNLVQQDIKELREHGDKLEEFADKRVAHHDKQSPKKLPTFAELDD